MGRREMGVQGNNSYGSASLAVYASGARTRGSAEGVGAGVVVSEGGTVTQAPAQPSAAELPGLRKCR